MKKFGNLICPLILMGALFLFNNGCKKDNNNPSDEVTDVDGNVYHTKKIGTQTWMLENLKTTHYNDGSLTPITFVNENSAWVGLTTSAYCWYNNDASNKNTYGALYNWYAASNSALCPTGWHVPTIACGTPQNPTALPPYRTTA